MSEEEKKEFLERQEFLEWFVELLYKTSACWERDILRACKEDLWHEFKKVKP